MLRQTETMARPLRSAFDQADTELLTARPGLVGSTQAQTAAYGESASANPLLTAGEPGVRYGLRVANRSSARVLAVLSIDGVNILTGESAAYDQRGYVFDPYPTP
jgi:hypothetical protein